MMVVLIEMRGLERHYVQIGGLVRGRVALEVLGIEPS